MLSRRRLKRNLKRFLIPVENAVVWTAGPLALSLYGMAHLLAHGLRAAANLLVIWR